MGMTTGIKILQEATLAHIRPRFNHLILHVTNLCNFRCNHCFVEFEKKPKDLTLDEIRPLAAEFQNLIWLDIGGGEPFIRADLHEIIGLFRAEEVSIPTNGWFKDKMLDQIEKIGRIRDLKKVILTMSIDGTEETHDVIRAKKGSFAKLKESFFEARKQFPDLRIKINTVLNERNVDELIDLMELVYSDFRPDYHGILFLRGSPINKEYRLPEVAKIEKLEDQIFAIQQKYHYGRKGLMGRITKNYQSIKREIANKIIEEKTQTIPCFGGRVHLVVYADGRVAPCELLPHVGSIRATPIREIVEGLGWKQAVERIQRKQCHCTHDCNMMENILFNFTLYPRLALN